MLWDGSVGKKQWNSYIAWEYLPCVKSKCILLYLMTLSLCPHLGPSWTEKALAAFPVHQSLPGEELFPGNAPQTPVEVHAGAPPTARLVRRGSRFCDAPTLAPGGGTWGRRSAWIGTGQRSGVEGMWSYGAGFSHQEEFIQQWRGDDAGRDHGGDPGGEWVLILVGLVVLQRGLLQSEWCDLWKLQKPGKDWKCNSEL